MSRRVRLFIQLSRPLFLIGGALVYALGAGIARYLGSPIDFGLYIIGQVWVTSMQLSTHYLNEYFDAPLDQDNSSRTPFSGGSGAIGPGKLTRNTALIAAMTTLTVLASITVVLLQQTEVSSLLVLLLMAIFFGAILYSTPPVQLSSSGYGELTTSFLVANLVPALAFYLQYHDLHRLVAMSTFPLTSLHMAMMIAFELPDYATDLKYEKNTLLVRLGWRSGMNLHNLLVLTAYLLLAIATFFSLPLAIALPAFLTLPLGLLQVWQIRRIIAGSRPNWTTLGLTAVVLFASMAYLLAFSFWTR